MGVRESLALDHFYLGIGAEDFESLIQLKDLLGATSHSKVVTTNDSWEGVYIGSRSKAYLEFLRDRRHGGAGFCLSPHNPFYVDANKIREDLKEIPWRHGTRVADDGQPWYDWIATCDYLDHRNTVFNAWIMKYHPTHHDVTRPIPTPSVDRFDSIQLRVGESYRAAIEEASVWFPGKRAIDGRGARFDLQQREGSPFTVEIKFIPGDTRFELESIRLRLVDASIGKKLQNANLGAFQVGMEAETAVFRMKS